MEHTVYNTQGKKAGTVALPEDVFATPWNNNLVHQVTVVMQANARTPIAHTKNRAEVSGTGKKPWRQKGTGNARHGSRRSPIWRTGGVAHGPRNERDYSQKINKKMRVKALYAVLSKKLADGEVLFVDTLSFAEPKTAHAKEVLGTLATISGFESLATKRKNSALIVEADPTAIHKKSFSNFGNLSYGAVRSLNPVEVLRYKYLIIVAPEQSVEILAGRAKKQTA
jgi:large subunit ribosomal protein L4